MAAAAVQYIGRTTYFEGKRLFDILCRLKNFGVGRVVYRNHFLKQYPEPTYYVIRKVEPDMSDPTQADPDDQVRSLVYVKKIFRGEDYGESILTSSYKADWKLVSRADEHQFLNSRPQPRLRNEVPDAEPFPPLLQHFIMAERKQTGQCTEETPMLPIKSVLRDNGPPT